MQRTAAGKAKKVLATAAYHAQEQAALVAGRIKYFQGLVDAFYATNTSEQQRDTALHWQGAEEAALPSAVQFWI